MDKVIQELIAAETKRQNQGIELIASENYPSKDVLDICGSVLMAKYAEGYPNARYYGGCINIDQVEKRAIELACQIFNCKFANVQPHCGSSANMEAYRAIDMVRLEEHPQDQRKMRILTCDLNSGAHLTHGSPVSFSSLYYDFFFFELGKDGKLDFSIIEKAIKEYHPDVLLTGYSAYPFIIDFKKFRELADKYHCYLMADIAHIAGLVAGGAHPSPFPYCDIVTTTTHKTLRGPRGGLILWNDEKFTKKVNFTVFPFLQGGPLENIIGGKAQCFYEASQPAFKDYALKVVKNTKLLRDELVKHQGVIIGETENHLFLLNVLASYKLNGKEAQTLLGEIEVTVNKNMIHNDTLTPNKTSGIRIGLAAITTRDINDHQICELADIIHTCLSSYKRNEEGKVYLNDDIKNSLLKRVFNITKELKQFYI